MYHIDEGIIDLPDSWIDKTMNVFVSSEAADQGVSFVIARERLPWGLEFGDYVVGEIGKLKEAVNGYKEIATQEFAITGSEARCVEYQCTAQDRLVQQMLVFVKHKERVLVLTVTCQNQMSETQRSLALKIIKGIRWRDNQNG